MTRRRVRRTRAISRMPALRGTRPSTRAAAPCTSSNRPAQCAGSISPARKVCRRRTGQWRRGRLPHGRPSPRCFLQRGFPMAVDLGLPVDRGHLIRHLSGGRFGPNIFRQDRALNRGWSEQGKRYRALERAAAGTPGALYFGHLLYVDDKAFPCRLRFLSYYRGQHSASSSLTTVLASRPNLARDAARTT